MIMDATERVLVCLRYGIGDVVMEMPALRGLRRQWPHAHLTALGAQPALELLEGDSVFDALMSIQAFGFQHLWDDGTQETRTKVSQWLEANNFQRILDAGHTVAGIQQLLAQLAVPILDTGGQLEAADSPDGNGARSIWRSAVRAWGLAETGVPPLPRLHVPDQAQQAAREFIRQRGLSGKKLIGIAPIASSPLKCWPLDHVCELVRRLTEASSQHLLIFGIPEADRETFSRLQDEAAPGRLHRVEPVHLQQTAAIITRCQALVSNDTGLMHMGAAVGTPTVAVFGPTSPRVTLPAGATPVSPGAECDFRHTDRFGSPECVLRNRCLVGDRSCIDSVSVDAVDSALTRLLA